MFTLTIMQCVNLMLTKTGQPNIIRHALHNAYLNFAVAYMIIIAIAICFINCPTLHMVPVQ